MESMSTEANAFSLMLIEIDALTVNFPLILICLNELSSKLIVDA